MHDRRTPSAMERLFTATLDLTELHTAPKPEVTPEQREEMGRWFVDRLRRGSGTIVIDVVKRKAGR